MHKFFDSQFALFILKLNKTIFSLSIPQENNKLPIKKSINQLIVEAATVSMEQKMPKQACSVWF